MKKEELLNSKLVKVAIPIILIGSVIAIFRSGYHTGQWLYVLFHH